MNRRFPPAIRVAAVVTLIVMALLAAPPAGATHQQATATASIPDPIKFPIVKQPITLSAYVTQFPWVSDVSTNLFANWLQDRTGIKLKFIVAPLASTQTKQQLLLSSGNYPDIFLSGSFMPGDISLYGVKDHILVPLNQYIAKYGVGVKEAMQSDPFYGPDSTAPDGNIYGLATVNVKPHGNSSWKMWVNNTWLKKLGMKPPTTTDEFAAMLKAFKVKDPGNTRGLVVPLSGAQNTWAGDPTWYLMNSFLYTDPSEHYLALSDGKVSYTANLPAFKDGLTYVHNLYTQGLIDPAAYTQNLTQLTQEGSDPRHILGAFTAGHLAMAINIATDDTKNWIGLPPLKGPAGVQVAPFVDSAHISSWQFAITTHCPPQYRAAAYQLADYLMTFQGTLFGNNGIPGSDGWTMANSGEQGWFGAKQALATLTPATSKDSTFYGQGSPQHYSWGSTGPQNWDAQNLGKITFLPKGTSLMSPDGYEARLTINELRNYAPYRQRTQDIPPLFVRDPKLIQQIALLQTPLDNYVLSSAIKFVTGKWRLDTQWQQYVDGLNKLGLPKYLTLEQMAISQTLAKSAKH